MFCTLGGRSGLCAARDTRTVEGSRTRRVSGESAGLHWQKKHLQDSKVVKKKKDFNLPFFFFFIFINFTTCRCFVCCLFLYELFFCIFKCNKDAYFCSLCRLLFPKSPTKREEPVPRSDCHHCSAGLSGRSTQKHQLDPGLLLTSTLKRASDWSFHERFNELTP